MVRHGESTYVAEGRFQGRHDPGLSPLGQRQAQLVAERLARREEGALLPVPPGVPVGIWHSPLRRAADTARAVAEQQIDRPPLIVSEGFIELAQGEWEGLLHNEVHARWPGELASWRRDPFHAHAPGGESLADAGGRVADALGEVITRLAAAHGEAARPSPDTAADLAATRSQAVPGYPDSSPAGRTVEPWAVLVAHDGIFRLALMTLLDLPYERFWSFPFSLCAISVISLAEGVPALRAHNLAQHLAPLAAREAAAEEARGDRRGAL
jgi:broad specificity phosphatase PhoE